MSKKKPNIELIDKKPLKITEKWGEMANNL